MVGGARGAVVGRRRGQHRGEDHLDEERGLGIEATRTRVLVERVPVGDDPVVGVEGLDDLIRICAPGGTIVLTTPNPLWTLPLWILEKARLKMPEGPHAFVSIRRVAARLRERGCAVRRVGTHAMIPARLLGLGPTVSRLAADLPLLRWAGVIQMVVATRPR